MGEVIKDKDLYIFRYNHFFLVKITTDAEKAKKSVDETAQSVEALQAKLNKLQRKFLKNNHDAREIKTQADVANEMSANTHDKAQKVKHLFKLLKYLLL